MILLPVTSILVVAGVPSATTVTSVMLPIILLRFGDVPLTVCQPAFVTLSTLTLTLGEGALGMFH